MAINKIVMNTEDGEKTLIDLTGDTVTPDTLAEGVTAHDASGNTITGTKALGADGGYYTPTVSQPDVNTMQISYTASKSGMAAVADQTITLPPGPAGTTPVKGTDYFTPADKGEIVNEVIAGLPTGTVANAVTLTTAQTVTGIKTFTASNLFDGEQKLTFAQYCPTVTDIANGIGASMKNARAVDCQLYVAEIYAPYCGAKGPSVSEPTSGLTATDGVISFYNVTGVQSGQPTGRTLLMRLQPDGLYVLGNKVITQNSQTETDLVNKVITTLSKWDGGSY